jgi:Type II intron maturase/MatK/TrnK amino terminal region
MKRMNDGITDKSDYNHLRNEEKIYPYFLQEDLYTKSYLTNQLYIKNDSENANMSFLQIKQTIHKIRYEGFVNENSFCFSQEYITTLSKDRTQCFQRLTLHILQLTLESTYPIDQRYQQSNLSHGIESTYKSLHIALFTIEYQWKSYGSIMEGFLHCYLHPEILVRMLRRSFRDISFLHFIRQILHHSILRCTQTEDKSIYLYRERLNIFFWNIYILEYHKFFTLGSLVVHLRHQSVERKKKNKNHCFKKISKWAINRLDVNHKHNRHTKTKVLQSVMDGMTYKYIRTRNSWLLSLESHETFINIIKKRYHQYLRYRLGYIEHPQIRRLGKIGKSTLVLGYQLELKLEKILIHIENLTSLLSTSIKTQSIFLCNPLLFLTRILAKYRFCNLMGYPISKSGWTPLSDSIIINRFKNIRNSIISYYTGCQNQKDLFKIQHILHYSCAKTLACKHKTNLRKIWGKYGKNLSTRDLYNHQKVSFDIIRKKNRLDSETKSEFWNFYLTQPDPMIILIEKIYKSTYCVRKIYI